MAPADRGRRGAALLEVLVALAILGAVGTSASALVIGAQQALRSAHRRDDEVRRASELLDAVALWSRDDLDRHLGDRPQGEWRLEVRQEWPTVYEVALRDSAGVPVLRTALFRPVPYRSEAIDAPR
jgi:type II secretory pathway pseudopilin PulG